MELSLVSAAESLKESGLTDAKGNVLPGSKLIVAMGPENQLTAEGEP